MEIARCGQAWSPLPDGKQLAADECQQWLRQHPNDITKLSIFYGHCFSTAVDILSPLLYEQQSYQFYVQVEDSVPEPTEPLAIITFKRKLIQNLNQKLCPVQDQS